MKRLGELLLEAGHLDDAGLSRALAHQAATSKRIGDCLLELSLLTEDQLFDTLARQLEIPIIAEGKLMMVDVPRPVLDLLPLETAWELLALPLLVDPSKRSIAVVTSEPNDPRTSEVIRRLTLLDTVKPYLAKRTAMRKILTKLYGPEPANGHLPSKRSGDKGRGEDLVELTDLQTRELPAAARAVAAARARTTISEDAAVTATVPLAGTDVSTSGRGLRAPRQRVIRSVIVADSNRALATGVKRTLETEGYLVDVATSSDEVLTALQTKSFDLVVVKGAIAEDVGHLERRVRSLYPMTEFRVVPSFATALMGEPVPYNRLADFAFDGLDLMLSLVARGDGNERSRAHTNGHYAKLVAQKLLLPRKAIDEVFLAAFVDALGEILVRQRGGDPTDRSAARRSGIDLFKSIHPPYDVETVLGSLDERVDGSGPKGLAQEQIPVGSRILAVVMGYHDAKEIPRAQMQKFLREMAGKTFDYRIVETFLQILRTEEILGNLESVGEPKAIGTLLIADPDRSHASNLEVRLSGEGYKVVIAADGAAALEAARRDPPSLVISEISLPKVDGFDVCLEMKRDPKLAAVPFVFVSGRNDERSSNRALDIGADDFVAKPVNIDFLLKKLQRFLARSKPAAAAPSGVQGRLADFGLIELIQTLSLGMKTVKLELTHDRNGEASIYLDRGRIARASTGTRSGEEAFYEIATWEDGAFRILNGQTNHDPNIGVSNDFLILESLRRIDESAAGIPQEGKEAVVTRRPPS